MGRPQEHDVSRYRVEALAKGLRVLQAFTPDRPELRLSEIALTAGLSSSTTFRMLATLESEGYVERTRHDSYRPSLGVLSLGFTALKSLDFVSIARPTLERLAQTTEETVNLGKLVGAEVLYLIRIRNGDLVTATVDVGTLLPAPATSMGKLQLSFLSETAARASVTEAALMAGRGPNAVRTWNELVEQLALIREVGWAVQDEELEYGLRSLAVPVFSGDATALAAVNVAVQASRWALEEFVTRLLPAAAKAGEEISRSLGFQGQYPIDLDEDGHFQIPLPIKRRAS